jgi:predicted NBD/HSP70 family sugar kinase
MAKSYSAVDIKERNYKIVFDIARRQGEFFRPDISKETGMTPPTVMKVVQAFIEREIFKEAGEAETSLGRRPTRIIFNSEAAYTIGLVFEGSAMHAGIVDLSGNVIKSIEKVMEHSFNESTVPVILQSIQEISYNTRSPILGVGLGVPGAVDSIKNTIEFAPLIGITTPTDCNGICREIQAQSGMPVLLENDVNAAAIGEYSFRKIPEDGDLLYIAVGTGVGAGIVLNGKIRKGRRNLAGELGYYVQNASFHIDRERPGWLESQVGLDALKRQFIWKGYTNSNEIPVGLIDYLVDDLGPAIANLATQMDIELIVLGGRTIDFLGDELFERLAVKIQSLSLAQAIIEHPLCAVPGVCGAAMQIQSMQIDQWLRCACTV